MFWWLIHHHRPCPKCRMLPVSLFSREKWWQTMGFWGSSATPKGFGKMKHCDGSEIRQLTLSSPLLFVEGFPLKQSRAPLFNKNNTFVSPSWWVNSILVGQIQLFAGEIHDFGWWNSWSLLKSPFFWWVQSPSPHHPPSNWALLTLPWPVAPQRQAAQEAQQVLGQAWARPICRWLRWHQWFMKNKKIGDNNHNWIK